MLLATCSVHAVSHLLGTCCLLVTCSVHVFGAQLRAGVGARGAQVNTTACIAHCAQVSVCACVPAVMLIARGYVLLVSVRVRSPNGNPRAQVRAYSGSLRGRV